MNKIQAFSLPSSPDILTNKKISIRTYSMLMFYSNWGGEALNNNTRYIYDNKIQDNLEDILTSLNISKSSFRTHLLNLRNYSKDIFKVKMINNELVYSLTPKDKNNKNFVLINSDILLKLISSCNETCVRIYLILTYSCINGPKQLIHQWLS